MGASPFGGGAAATPFGGGAPAATPFGGGAPAATPFGGAPAFGATPAFGAAPAQQPPTTPGFAFNAQAPPPAPGGGFSIGTSSAPKRGKAGRRIIKAKRPPRMN